MQNSVEMNKGFGDNVWHLTGGDWMSKPHYGTQNAINSSVNVFLIQSIDLDSNKLKLNGHNLLSAHKAGLNRGSWHSSGPDLLTP